MSALKEVFLANGFPARLVKKSLSAPPERPPPPPSPTQPPQKTLCTLCPPSSPTQPPQNTLCTPYVRGDYALLAINMTCFTCKFEYIGMISIATKQCEFIYTVLFTLSHAAPASVSHVVWVLWSPSSPTLYQLLLFWVWHFCIWLPEGKAGQ